MPAGQKVAEVQDLALTADPMRAFSGHYRRRGTEAWMRAVQGRLEVDSDRYGRFYLTQSAPGDFLVEDTRMRLQFESDDAGQAQVMRVWFRPDRPVEFERVPKRDSPS